MCVYVCFIHDIFEMYIPNFRLKFNFHKHSKIIFSIFFC